MLSRTNEMIAVGALILYLAFVPSLQLVRDLLSTSVGKAFALAAIVYVHQKVSCSVALLLVVVYLRAGSWEGFTAPTSTVEPTMTCPDGYALDAVTKSCMVSSSMAGSIPPAPTGSAMGASVTTPPPNSAISTAPMTTPMPTMPPVLTTPPITSGGVQPAMSTSSSSAGV
jgi:hypothetical protein